MRFAFLVYVARSGSTLLTRQLAARCPSVHVLPEFQLPDILLQTGESRVRALSSRQLERLLKLDPQLESLGFSPGRIAALASQLSGVGVRGILERVVAETSASGADELVLLKKGALLEHAHTLRRLFPESILIHIVRDPRGVANSMLKSSDPYLRKGPMGRGDPYFIGTYWNRFCGRIDDLRRDGSLPIHEVSYESLLDDPAEVIDRLAAALGVRAEAPSSGRAPDIAHSERELHALVTQAPQEARASAWRDELRTWQGVTVEHLTRSGRASRGYPAYYLGVDGKASVIRCLVRGYLHHGIRTAGHTIGGVFHYMSQPQRIPLRMRRLLRKFHR